MLLTTHSDLDGALRSYQDATNDLCGALGAQAELALNADHEKLAAVQRIMDSGPNPANGKPHSATSAAELVTMDPEFKAFRQAQTLATLRVERARAAQDAARILAQALALTPEAL